MGYPITSQITQDLANDSWSPLGDTTDHGWYQSIRFNSGKAHSQAVAILARIVYMYRPARENVRGPGTELVYEERLSQKFLKDLWQTSRQSLADTFGFTIREVDSALVTLRRVKVIYTELRSLTVNGVKQSNVLYIGLNLPKLRMISSTITFERDTYLPESQGGQSQNVTPVSPECKTYTKTSPKTSAKTTTLTGTSKRKNSISPSAPPSNSKFNIPETILNLIPENKRNEKELSKVSAALSVSSEEVIVFNISRALAKAKKDDPWGMVASMLTDLALNNCDWYAADRQRIEEKDKTHDDSKRRRNREESARKTKEDIEAREQLELHKLYILMPEESQQIVKEEAKRRVAFINPNDESLTLIITDVIRDIQRGVWNPPDPAEFI